jgi:molybdopterin converting factor small subunit
MLQPLAGGREEIECDGATVADVIEALERSCPGLRDRLVEGDRLRPNLSVAVDGVIGTIGLREPVGPESEVHFVAAIRGGASMVRGFRVHRL